MLVALNSIQIGFLYFLRIRVKYSDTVSVILLTIINVGVVIISFLLAWDVSVVRYSY